MSGIAGIPGMLGVVLFYSVATLASGTGRAGEEPM